jgi:hypothetical protein
MPAPNGYIFPRSVQTNNNTTSFMITRSILKESWNTHYKQQLSASSKKMANSSFRVVNNAGDILSRKNYSSGGSIQTFQSRPGLHGLGRGFGSITNNPDGTNIPAAACNVKWVYDSSDYSRYLKQKTVSNNYYDTSYGGDQSNASQSTIKAMRRF